MSTMKPKLNCPHAALLKASLGLALLALAGKGQLAAAQSGLPKEATLTPAAPRFNHAPGPVASHRFWAAKNWFATNLTTEGHAYTMFPEPLAVQTTPHGLLVGYSASYVVEKSFFVHPIQMDFTLGVAGLNAGSVSITGSTDRMVDFDFGPITTRVGRGMPFVYAETHNADATVTFVATPEVFATERSFVGVAIGPNNYGLFCPSKGRWIMTDKVFRCHAPGRSYLSIAVLPSRQALALYARHAFAFPVDTHLNWSYDSGKGTVSTTFEVVTAMKEGTDAGFLQALYPHQYASLAGAGPSADTYASARGPMRVLDAKSFTTVDSFHGLLPFLPVPAAFDKSTERSLLKSVADEPEHFAAPDTYGQGKALGRIAELLPLAQMNSDSTVGERFAAALRKQFAYWSDPSPRALHQFTDDAAWGTLIGYPASFGSNTQLNDHHFHYGYWIHAAALLGLYDPAWLHKPETTQFLGQLIGDIATLAPHDSHYPQLRHFDAYAGHSWASGQAPFGDGENQESTSEAIHAWAGIALFAAETGNLKLRDAAIWMYTLETNAAFNYWFNDGPVSTFPAGFAPVQITNLFDGKADTATWFGNAPEFEHGIQFLPFTGSSLYLGRDVKYARHNLAEVMQASNGNIRKNSNYWPDLMEMYQAFYDPQRALASWRNTSFTFDGETKAHEFAWLSSMVAYGRVDESITADTTFYAAFRSDTGTLTHIAFNPATSPIDVHFSDGIMLTVPAKAMSCNGRTVASLPQ
jgi:endoglucanase Acf2